ncbi:MAG: hypothetical protein CTY34_11475 [Methylobacter sp.]|nr:MAG: hypothetical protein CTY34_11475 [Methylobacter sp.]PPD02500.1 MAG: hypothetical protein CTY29_12815 [Methylobacter sp.]PPD17826.1 MAG: hypothetical protein CTY24_14165 [Methylobacter sp.]PPD36527.1 MAG: hypothetical protein CTY18_03905 [Methylomonas sp.]
MVQIYAYDAEDDPCIGTGYCIGNGLILTARHVVLFDGRHENPRLKLVWPEQKFYSEVKQANAEFTMSFTDEDIVFKGNSDFDIAVILCPKSTPFNPPKTNLARANPKPTTQWSSRGFPRAGKEGSIRTDLGISGTIQGIHSPRIELNTPVQVNQENGWAGLSGAPVFVGNELVAVITEDFKRLESYLLSHSIPSLYKEPAFHQAVGILKQASIEEITEKLCEKLIREIEHTFKSGKIPFPELNKVLQLDIKVTNSEIAKYLINDVSAGKAIGSFFKLATELEAKWSANHPELWENFLTDVEQVCCWLLLKSVNPDWWFEYESRIVNNDGITNQFSLDNAAYVEVIISRWLLKLPQYSLNKANEARPSHDFDVLLFDAASQDASDIQLLSEIYKDLRRGGEPPQNVEKLLKAIEKTARSTHQDLGKPIYYLVTQEYLELLKSRAWFAEAEMQLASHLQFICCDFKSDQTDHNPCSEDQDLLLEKIASILRMRNPKRQHNA